MRQKQFESHYQQDWLRLDKLLAIIEPPSNARIENSQAIDRLELPQLYQNICHQLSIAESRGYSQNLIQHLHGLTLRAHHQIYLRRYHLTSTILQFFAAEFPQTLRRHWVQFCLALSFFYGPGIVFGLACFHDPELIYTMLNDSAVAEMEYLYNPAEGEVMGRTKARQAASDFMMFGHYIYNNISIGFQTFAGGMLVGLGTLFYLVFNGLVIGGVSGYLTKIGFGDNFWLFVSGHSAFELTAIIICGTAGLLLAKAILSPENWPRRHALKLAAKDSVRLICGAAGMLVLAALIEAFWSSTMTVPAAIKYTVCFIAWVLVTLYLIFAGRAIART